MSALAEQLRQLHRQAGRTMPRVTPDPAVIPMQVGTPTPRGAIPEDIRRLLGIRTNARAARPVEHALPRAVEPSRDRALPGEEIAPGLHYRELHLRHDAIPTELDASFSKHGDIASARLLHFDTETTGLAGGTGTRAFMIGVADWRDGGLRLRQLTITTMAAEAGMLRQFASWIDPTHVLVSYNGKSYDAPLLATRYRLARLDNPLTGLPHLDLLHPVRRRWRGRWENCRLATIERHLLGIVREDDLPGSEAPRAWRDYLRGGSARDLRRVGAHNAQDLSSLAELCLRLARVEAD